MYFTQIFYFNKFTLSLFYRKVIEPEEPSEELNRLRRDLIETVLKPGYQVNPDPPPCWTKHSTTFGLKIDWFQGDPRRWSYKQVSAFINTIHPMRNRVFIDQVIIQFYFNKYFINFNLLMSTTITLRPSFNLVIYSTIDFQY